MSARFCMCSYIPDVWGQMWQHVLGEIDSAIDIANQMAQATVPVRHSLANPGVRMWLLEAPRYNEIRIVPLTTENLALHDLFHGRTTWIIPSEDLHSSLEKGWLDGRLTHYVSISSGSMEATRDNNLRPTPLKTIRVGPIFGPACTECAMFPAVRPSRDIFHFSPPRCYRCIQRSVNEHQALCLMNSFCRYPALRLPSVALRIVVFILGTGLEKYCHCGCCYSDWFLYGWECWPVHM